MTDHFDVATAAARRCVRKLLKTGAPNAIVADAFIAQALAVWAADTGRQHDAEAMLATWVAVRDFGEVVG
ncbi:hypothetical protein H6M51_11185 [Rhizobium sp. AQ_MP]|uniref:hypothetical protein n=1 Tax=Rhizobium sp. AQ_MP TaxID=2761536 RepID=UPI00163A49F3|nr:hypothetical protein [Rhizobium sp. AQ_MP]MBC2773431.1 hypothetical protein [Rhizobium sp. AQ_MP]